MEKQETTSLEGQEPPKETTNKDNKPVKETIKFNGIAAQINLSPGSETHRRFAELMTETGAYTSRGLIEMLIESYRNKGANDNSEAIKELQKQLAAITKDRDELNDICDNQKTEIEKLNKQLEAANNTANENATAGLGKQLQLEELQKKMEGAIIVHPNPVTRYFLDEMASKTNTPADKILEKLFFEDLQNPRANNLPYTVTSPRIEKVMDELKKRQNNG